MNNGTSAASAAAYFDPFDINSYYFPSISRDEATEMLSGPDVSVGTFLLRNSGTSLSDHSLSVRETSELNGIRHYLLQKIEVDSGECKYQIGDQTFPDVPTLMNHFKMKRLAETTLIRPVKRPQMEKVVALYGFDGERESDLPFRRGEELHIIAKPEECWWTAQNALGQTGFIPSTYVQSTDTLRNLSPTGSSISVTSDKRDSGASSDLSGAIEANDVNANPPPISSSPDNQNGDFAQHPKTPCWVRVIQERIPNAYDKEALRLRKGDLIHLTKILPSGTCEGTLQGRTGLFPFTYVAFCDDPGDGFPR